MLDSVTEKDRSDAAAQLYARLNRLPMTRVQGRILMQGGISTVLDGLDNGIVSFILPVAATAFAMTGTEQGLFASAALYGALLGDLCLGVLGNHIGRRALLIWSLVLYSVATMTGALSPSWQFLVATRFIAGIGIGVSVNVVIPYLAEFAPPKQRAHYVGSLAGFFGFGFVLAALFGLIIPTSGGDWRLVLVLVGIPVLIGKAQELGAAPPPVTVGSAYCRRICSALGGVAHKIAQPSARQLVTVTDGACPFQLAISEDTCAPELKSTRSQPAPDQVCTE